MDHREVKARYLKLLRIKEERRKYNLINTYFPDEGPLRRELYKKHLEFFAMGKKHSERLALAANRVGKTEPMGGYESALHLTGNYPIWWNGARFDKPIDAWAAGKTSQTTRDIIQLKLVGRLDDIGTGLIPKDKIKGHTLKRGVPDALETIAVQHKSGGISYLSFKSFDQGRQSFEGTKKDLIWLDEECPQDIYNECLLRTTDTTGGDDNGLMILTFTPLMGLTELVLSFLPGGELPVYAEESPRAVITATWDDVPHLSQRVKDQLLASIPPFQRDARSRGVPQLGAGAIYPVSLDDIFVDDFQLPDHFRYVWGFDVGWRSTAAVWIAYDNESDVIYVYSEYKRGEVEPVVHAAAFNARKIPQGVFDPAARGRSQHDGQKLADLYKEMVNGKISPADNAVEAGLLDIWDRMSSGRFKIFKSCTSIREEIALYRRDEKGNIVKANDHLMDAMRYAARALHLARPRFQEEKKKVSFRLTKNSPIGGK